MKDAVHPVDEILPLPKLCALGFIGGGIEVEIFSLDYEAFGSFVADVPPPLAIGNVRLEDGRCVKGFICESAALSNACEITGFGGWRAYLSDRPATRVQASA